MNDRGMALITGLLLLAAISLLALVGLSGMILQKHMASNFRHSATALQNADRAQSEGRAWLFSRADHERETGCIVECLLPTAIHPSGELPARIEFESPGWWQLNAIEAGVDPSTGQPVSPWSSDQSPAPRWAIEELHFEPLELAPPLETTRGVGYYRIFSRGEGPDAKSVAVTEAIVARPWGENFGPESYPAQEVGSHFCDQLPEESEPSLECGIKAWRQRR